MKGVYKTKNLNLSQAPKEAFHPYHLTIKTLLFTSLFVEADVFIEICPAFSFLDAAAIPEIISKEKGLASHL
jgi:hypothetical protein